MDYLKINNFKCFINVDIPLNALTVLAGANANGKSSTIQSLLYLRQTLESVSNIEDTPKPVPLNGKYCLSLGSSDRVVNINSETSQVTIGIFNEHNEILAQYESDSLEPKLWLGCNFISNKFDGHPLHTKEFYYLNAERVGPRIIQSLNYNDFPNAGWQGESTAQLIGLENGYYKIDDKRRFADTQVSYISDQVNNWLGYIMNGVKVTVETNYKTLISQLLLENSFNHAQPTLMTNLGFGVSYILPIIATGLIAQEGAYFIVENPEAHLHPAAQTKIGEFLAMVATAGVNVIIETHSDHIINGIQLSIVKKIINNDNVTINYFYNDGSSQPDVQSLSISSNGELSDWPNGFFDQSQIDYAELFRLRKK